MSARDDRLLLRWIHGELATAEDLALRERLRREPALAARLAELQKRWEGLELPPAAAVPVGFAQRLGAQARALSNVEERPLWRVAPTWVRAVAGVALAAGIALGVGLGTWLPQSPTTTVTTTAWLPQESTLAENYWQLVDEPESTTAGVAVAPQGESTQ